ncbi:MAG: cytochrome c [Longimicrobiales bacterium]
MTPKTLFAAALLVPLTAACGGGADPAPATPAPAPSAPAVAPPAPAAAAAALYSDAQAQRGRQVFRDSCAECHYSSEMRDDAFQFEWERRTVGQLLNHVVGSMPDDAPGSLPMGEYVDVIAYILSLNGFPAGPGDLTADSPGLETRLAAPGGAP